MDKATLLTKIFWHPQAHWCLRRPPVPHELSVPQTVQGLQRLLLARQGAMLAHTLQQVFARPVAFQEINRLDIVFYQEGADQRVWRAQAKLTDGTTRAFGIIVARAPGASSALTQRDFRNLQELYAHQERYCVRPYACDALPGTGGVTAYTVEWLDHYKELVFEITHEGGSFLVNARGAHRVFSPQESRQIWRRLVEILCWYPGVRRVNIQAGDFVGRIREHGQIDLKLTTARELVPDSTPAEQLHAILQSVITASGYLSDGRHPFDRHMPEAVFLQRMQAVLRRRFGNHAARLARQQWLLFQRHAFAQQEDWLKEDCILATYDRLRADRPAVPAWQQTCQHWMAYVNAVQAGHYPPSWWFPASEIPAVLNRLTRRRRAELSPHRWPENALPQIQKGEPDDRRKNHPADQ
jgi:hypothetical protein